MDPAGTVTASGWERTSCRSAGVRTMREPGDRAVESADLRLREDHLSRRRWLMGTALAWPGFAMSAWGQGPSRSREKAGEADVVRQVEERAKRARLGPI